MKEKVTQDGMERNGVSRSHELVRDVHKLLEV